MGENRYRDTLTQGYRLLWYELKSVIGRGGYGITYLAYDTNLDQNVAIKEYLPVDFATRHDDSTVHPVTGEKAELFSWGLHAFLTEARTLARFRHPSIVTVYSVFEANQTAYMVMEFAQGTDLADYYRQGDVVTEQAFLDIFLPITDGLALVHEAGFIHRDIKPSNIYICQDMSPVLLDFGSARQSIEGKTQAMTSLVTYGYAPYEQFNEGKDKQGPWTDIYGLGASIYTGITGDKPADALKRAGGILDDSIDPYQPVSLQAEGRYSRNFLLAVDYALRFRADERPRDIRLWADMLCGRQAAPELPEVGDKRTSASEEATRIRPTQSVRPATAGTVGSSTSQVSDHEQPRYHHQLKRRLRSLADVLDPRHMAGRTRVGLRKPWPGVIAGLIVVACLLGIVMLVPWYGVQQADEEKDSAQTQQLVEYLRKADQYFNQQRYTGDAADNALYFLLQAYALDASSPRVNRSIERLLERQGALIQQAISEHRFDQAGQDIDRLQRQIPDAMIISTLKNSLEEKRLNVDLQQTLLLADQALADGRLDPDSEQGAAALYRKVLQMDADNSRARAGLAEVSSRLVSRAEADIAAARYSRAEKRVAALRAVAPEHSALLGLQRSIDAENKKQQHINQTLQQANAHYRAGRLTRPADRNALDAYRQLLKLQPNHQAARDGINKIYTVYKKRFDKHLHNHSFDQAEADIRVMEKITGRSQALGKLQAELNRQRKLSQQARMAPPPPVKVTRPEADAEDPPAKPDKPVPVEEKKSVPLGTFF